MRPTDPTLRARAIAGASWTLLVIGLCAAGGEAKADCAQDARHRVAIGVEFGLFDGKAGTEQTGEPTKAPKPCNGPSCSGNSAAPTTDAPATPIDVEAWGLLVETTAPPTLASAHRPDDSASIRPIGDASAIFHPPRCPA